MQAADEIKAAAAVAAGAGRGGGGGFGKKKGFGRGGEDSRKKGKKGGDEEGGEGGGMLESMGMPTEMAMDVELPSEPGCAVDLEFVCVVSVDWRCIFVVCERSSQSVRTHPTHTNLKPQP